MSSPSSSPNSNKRKFVTTSISPPPLRRKVQSTTTRKLSLVIVSYLSLTCHLENAVASFFTKTSQKPPEKIKWQERAPNNNSPNSLIVGKYDPIGDVGVTTDRKRLKVAAFDFVS